MQPINKLDRLEGALLGTALGDALGLPMEGLSSSDIAQRFSLPVQRFQLLGERGYVSDDTEQTALVAEALLRGSGDVDTTDRHFRHGLRAWFLRLPFGIGWSTLRACLRLCLGMLDSGVRSAGNGAAMRATILGAHLAERDCLRARMSLALARVTHTDPRAIEGAAFVAELAAQCALARPGVNRTALVHAAAEVLSHPELCAAIAAALELAGKRASVASAAHRLGTSGFVVHSVGLATYAFLAHGDAPLSGIQAAIAAGGDTDTTAAIVGGWVGALHGAQALPADLVSALHDGPFGPTHLRALAAALHTNGPPPRWSAAAAMVRNLALYPVVLWHGLRRLWPAGSRREVVTSR
jgi:ADP-ribosyl-[dinitrogen reductase] hydrolase